MAFQQILRNAPVQSVSVNRTVKADGKVNISGADDGSILVYSESAPVTFQFSVLAGRFRMGFHMLVIQAGGGLITFDRGDVKELNNRQGLFTSAGTHAVMSVICYEENKLVLAGDLA